ncbi:MAG: ABC transporter ATP-binding protein [Firmicutes bacterium]|nr:ABC transporter ATP-binding protein [Bacillota bacterium]
MRDYYENALEIRGLTKKFKNFTLDNIDLTVPAGSIVGLIGENGAGKTTTIKAAVDLIHKDGGTVTFFGRQLAEDPNAIKEQLSVVFEDVSFNPQLTTAQAEKILKSIYKSWDSEAWADYMHHFGLSSDKPIKDFSKGMRVKFNLAAALSHNARLLLLDEPTSGLDPVMRDEILDIFMEFMQEEDHAILLSSHITTDLEKIADYIAFIHDGRLIFCEKKDDLLYNYGIIRCAADVLALISPEDRLAVYRQEFQCNVLTADRHEAARRYPELVIDAPTIDEIMVFYVKGEK